MSKPQVTIKITEDSEEPGYGPTEIEVIADGVSLSMGTIGGEPEDNCIVRDYAWVVPMLRKLAERLGADVTVEKEQAPDSVDPSDLT